MSLRYGYFDSEITGYDEEGMPIFDRAESSDFFALFISSLVSDGVLANPGNCFQVVAHEGMSLKVRPGFGIIRGRLAYDKQDYTIELSKAPTSYKRIDRVVLRANYLNRLCEIVVKEGTTDANPVAPELLQPTSGDYYELSLATVEINSNQVIITQSNITDTRADSTQCGFVTQLIDHLDTSIFYAQLDAFYAEFVDKSNKSYEQFKQESEAVFTYWFNNVKEQLSEDAAGNLLAKIEAIPVVEVSNENTVTESGIGLDARQANPTISGTMANKIEKIDNAINGLSLKVLNSEEYEAMEVKNESGIYFVWD